MTEKPIPSKNEEARRKEAERLRAETERSIEAARAKLAHGTIEAIERLRKASAIHSLHERISFHGKMTNIIADSLGAFAQKGYPFDPVEIENVREQMRTYESIRTDFKDVMGLSDERLERLYPKVSSYFETRAQAITVLVNMLSQEAQMEAYSLRMISGKSSAGIDKKGQ